MDVKEIKEEIKRLEKDETTYSNCSKLAVLTAVYNHLEKPGKQEERKMEYSFGASEFLLAVQNAPLEKVLGILDEHLEAIKIIYPKEYSIILKKIREATY